MGYVKIIKASELGTSWSPQDHIHEARLDELLEAKAKCIAKIRHEQKKLFILMCEITRTEHLIEKSPGKRLGE